MANDLIIGMSEDLISSVKSKCEEFSNSCLCPANFKGKPGDLFWAFAYGHKFGLDFLESVQSIAVVNGKPMLWGDATIAIAKRNKNFDKMEVQFSNNNTACTCTIYKKDKTKFSYTYTKEMAQQEGKMNNPVWKAHLSDMLYRRATRKACKYAFPDDSIGFDCDQNVYDDTNEFNENKNTIQQDTPQKMSMQDWIAKKQQEKKDNVEKVAKQQPIKEAEQVVEEVKPQNIFNTIKDYIINKVDSNEKVIQVRTKIDNNNELTADEKKELLSMVDEKENRISSLAFSNG